MFTISKSQYTGSDQSLVEAICLSTDTKQTAGIANGSLCLEMDTGDIYCFNGASGQWIKLGGGSTPQVS